MTDASGTPTLAAELLRRVTDPAALGFDTTAGLADIDGLLGQDRATDAIRLSARIGRKGFNLFVLGAKGAGRRHTVDRLLGDEAARRPVPCDWVYVNNFDAPEKPRALQLPAGVAAPFKSAMEEMVDDLAIEIPTMFESEDYQTRRRAIEQDYGERHEKAFTAFTELAKSKGVALLRTPAGFALVAIKDDKLLEPEAFAKLPKEEQDRLNTLIEGLQEKLADLLKGIPAVEKAHRRDVEKLHAELAERAVAAQIDAVAKRFSEVEAIAGYLKDVREDMIANADLFLASAGGGEDKGAFPDAIAKFHREPEFQRYGVNVMVSQHGRTGAPMEREFLPSMANLTGRIEHIAEMGALVTDFMLIKPGALHRANGGYLVLDAARVLTEPFAWDALKRCLDTGKTGQMLREARLEHKRHGVVEFFGLQIGIRCALKGGFIRPMRQHHIVQAHPARNKAFGFGIILAVNIAHQFGHDVLVIPRRAEGILGHHPAFAKQHKVDIRRARNARRRGQHRENRGVGMIEKHRAHRAIGFQIVFARRIIAMPCHHVQRRMADAGFVELPAPFDGDG